MKNIKVLGTGCAKCKSTEALIRKVAEEKGVQIELEKIEDVQDIMRYSVMSTPAVVVNEKVVHAGGLPAKEDIVQWLED